MKYLVGPGNLTRGELRRLLADAGASAAEVSNLTRDDPVGVATAKGLAGLEVGGAGAVEARARDFLAVFSRLDRTVALPPGAELGLVLERIGEWAVVAETPVTTAVRVGDVLSEVEGVPCLLEAYDDTFARCAAARRSRVPYTLTFRRAPFHRGWLRKRSRGRSASRFSGLTGWKRRFFVLRCGTLTYYDREPGSSSVPKPKGAFSLARRCTVRIRYNDGILEPALMAANDRLVIRGADSGDVRNWAALCTVATAHATGGTALLRDYERERLGVERREAERPSSAAARMSTAARCLKNRPRSARRSWPRRRAGTRSARRRRSCRSTSRTRRRTASRARPWTRRRRAGRPITPPPARRTTRRRRRTRGPARRPRRSSGSGSGTWVSIRRNK